MTEEFITKRIINYLLINDWEIIAFDFPQSGTGRMLHPNNQFADSKNMGGIIPDIISQKGNTGIIIENKDRFYPKDFFKISSLINDDDYSNAIDDVFAGNTENLKSGIGLPLSVADKIPDNLKEIVDYIYGVKSNGQIELIKG